MARKKMVQGLELERYLLLSIFTGWKTLKYGSQECGSGLRGGTGPRAGKKVSLDLRFQWVQDFTGFRVSAGWLHWV